MRKLISICLSLCLWLTPISAERIEGIPLPSSLGDKGIHVWHLQSQLHALGYLDAQADGVFGMQTELALYTYQLEKGLLPSGEADEETISLLFIPPAPQKGETLRPYWYGGGSEAVPVGARFEIKDVRTGLIFECVRIMGISHLDAEPVSSEDTAIMLQAYGGQWSWSRRPILLRYSGNVYAASMNGMPHSWDVIARNNMKGHFCVHFFGSRVDGSQRVDPDHLACAVEAALAHWD